MAREKQSLTPTVGARRAARSAGREYADQTREELLQVFGAQGDEPLRPLGPYAGNAGLAQELEVVGAGGRGNLEGGGELAAQVLPAVGQQPHDLQPDGISDRAHDRRQVERIDLRMRDLLTGGCRWHDGHDTTFIVP